MRSYCEFDKNANSVSMNAEMLFVLNWFGDYRSLRFLCGYFGSRTFYFYREIKGVFAMAKNADLNKANKAKKDEFYTQITDLEKEMRHYREHFRDKVIFCNCDDPEYSNFWRYFQLNFYELGLKKLISTHFDESKPSYRMDIVSTDNGLQCGIPNYVRTPLKQNGDFRSPECIEILKEADIVITNPPFSLFREYIAQLMEYKKQFIILGNVNAITYKEVFPWIMNNQVWFGASIHSGDREFLVPDTYPLNASGYRVDMDGKKYIRVKGVRWFTNLDYEERHEDLPLYRCYSPEEYPHYDNYDAIEVSKTAEIPCDYDGVMGVPITYIDKYNPDQFEIIGMAKRGAGDPALKSKVYTKADYSNYSDLNATPVIITNGTPKNTYPRLLIRRKQ